MTSSSNKEKKEMNSTFLIKEKWIASKLSIKARSNLKLTNLANLLENSHYSIMLQEQQPYKLKGIV